MQTEHWSARHSKPIIFLILTCVGVGIYLAFSIPIEVFPKTDFPRIIIGADNGVTPIDQMQVTITRPIEEAVNAVPGIERVLSITSRGTAEVNIFFDWNVDMDQTLNFVNAAIAEARTSLPPSVKITAERLTFAKFPIMGYSLTSKTVPQTRLWELATYDLRPRLNRLFGVSEVVVQGGQEPEFEITPDPAKLIQTTVTIPNLLDAIRRSNIIDSPGMMESNHELVLALVSGQAKDIQELSDIVVKNTPAGMPVRIGDIATVQPSFKPVYTLVTANGNPAVLLNIKRQRDGNTVTVADAVHKEIEKIRKTLPSGIELQSWYDQSEIVNASIMSVRDAIIIGLVLASFIMVLFLRDWGTSLVAGLVIPATVALTFIALRTLGLSFNLMTLGGLAAAVGLVIDDAIVVVENIIMHRDSGKTRGDAVRSALREITIPLIGSTLTPIVVFLPLISMLGVEGVFFRSLALTVGVALLTSLALALTWTPALSHFFIRDRRARLTAAEAPRASDAPREGPVIQSGFIAHLARFYGVVLRGILRHPVTTASLALVLIAGSLFCYQTLGKDLLPKMDEGGFILDYLMPAGSSLEETNRVLTQVEIMLRNTPEVESTSRRTGMELGLAAVTEANRGDFAVKLKKKRSRSADEVIKELRNNIVEKFPMLQIEFPLLLQDMIGDLTGEPKPIEIKLYSQDPSLLRTWAPKVAEEIQKSRKDDKNKEAKKGDEKDEKQEANNGIVDVRNGIDNTISGPATTFQVDQTVATRAGFSPEEIELDASVIMQGEPAPTPVVIDERPYTIRVRFPESTRASLQSMLGTVLGSSTGQKATLGSLSKVIHTPGQIEIRRDNLQPVAIVTAELEDIDLGSAIKTVKEAVARLNLPPAIRVEYGGTYKEQQRSFRDLVLVLIFAIVLVFIVLLFEFGDFAAPVAILSSALLSTSGVFVALLITGKTFNLASFMGLIMVVGIVAKNGILLLDADKKYRKEGMSAEEAMIAAGERRLRPIMMTALATIAGMIPLSLAFGAGAQMLQPLAIAVIGGIAASMVLSLIVTPAVNYYLTRR
jgi:CzcA family heavy metal efflux pump